MIYSKNKINGVIIDYDLLGEIQDIKTERINFPIPQDPSRYLKRSLSIKETINPNWYKDASKTQIMQWMQQEQKYLEKFKKTEILSGVLE